MQGVFHRRFQTAVFHCYQCLFCWRCILISSYELADIVHDIKRHEQQPEVYGPTPIRDFCHTGSGCCHARTMQDRLPPSDNTSTVCRRLTGCPRISNLFLIRRIWSQLLTLDITIYIHTVHLLSIRVDEALDKKVSCTPCTRLFKTETETRGSWFCGEKRGRAHCLHSHQTNFSTHHQRIEDSHHNKRDHIVPPTAVQGNARSSPWVSPPLAYKREAVVLCKQAGGVQMYEQ